MTDRWWCKCDDGANFSVNSIYLFLGNFLFTPLRSGESDLLGQLWKSYAPSRIIVLHGKCFFVD